MTAIRTLFLPLMLLAVSGPAPLLAQAAPAAADAVATAPVEIDGTVLFRVRGSSSLPAAERASGIRERIVAAAADPAVTLLNLSSVDRDGAVRISAGERLLMMVLDADGAVEELSRAELATAHMMRIRQAITDYRAARTPAALERSAIRTAIATALLVAA